MNRIVFKFFRFAGVTLGSLGLLALSSPWVLSHPTCLKFACSLLSAKIGKHIECSSFQWQPFGKTEIGSLSISQGVDQFSPNLEIGRLTIDDPFLVILEYIKGKPILELLSNHAEIDSVCLKLNQLKLLKLTPQDSSEGASNRSFLLSLFAKNLKPLLQESLFLQNLSKDTSLSLLLDGIQEKLPESFEIPFTIDYRPSEIDLIFTSPEVHGSASLVFQEELNLTSQLDSSLTPSYHFDLAATIDKKEGLVHLDSSIVSELPDGNALLITCEQDALKAKIHLSHLDLFLQKEGYVFSMIPHQLDVEGLIGLKEQRAFSLKFTSDLGNGHFVGRNEPSQWVLEEADLNLNVAQAKSFFQDALGDFIVPKSLSMKAGPTILSKRKGRLEYGDVQVVVHGDFLGIESVATHIHTLCRGNYWETRIDSILSAQPIELAFDYEASSLFANLLKPVDISSTTLEKLLTWVHGKDVSLEDLRLSVLSFKMPLAKGTTPFSDLKAKLETRDLKIRSHGSEFSTGALEITAYSPSVSGEWRAAIQSGDDHCTLRYKSSFGNALSFSAGTLEIEKLPLGKWIGSSAHFSDFKIDAEVRHTGTEKISFNVAGNSSADELVCVGSFEPTQLVIEHALYESSPQEANRGNRKIKLSHLSYLPLQQELFVEEGTLEDRIDKKSTILGNVKSTDLGLEVDLQILDADGHSKFHLEALTKSIFNLQSLTAHKLEIQADHCPLSTLTERHIPFSRELQDIIGDELTCSLQLENGDLKSRFRSNKLMLSFSGRFENGYFLSTKPFFAQVNLDKQSLSQLARWFPAAEHCQFAHPLNLRIEENSIKIPVFGFDWNQVSAKGSLELGQFVAPSPSFGRSLLKILKQRESHDALSFWSTPVDFQIDQGKIKIERVDFLVQDKLHLAFWGNGELTSNQMNYHLGVAQDTLGELFGLHGLPHDFLLSLPLVHKKKKIDLDMKEALKSIEQVLLLQGSVSGAVPSWLDQFLQLGKHSLLPYPPLQYKLPWAVAREENIEKKAKNKLKPKIKEQEIAKPEEKSSTVEKAKEWVELFKIFKVLK